MRLSDPFLDLKRTEPGNRGLLHALWVVGRGHHWKAVWVHVACPELLSLSSDRYA